LKIFTPSNKPLFSEKDDFVLDKKDEVFQFLSTKLAHKLNEYLPAFEKYRSVIESSIIDPNEMAGLPYNQSTRLWTERVKDIEFLQPKIKDQSEILEVGGWNGWLTNWLSKKNSVTSIDYFINERDGLKARKHYKNANWTSIQCAPSSIQFMESKFDYIIFNRGIQFYANLPELIRICQAKINPGGSIIITGLNFYTKSSSHVENYDQVAAEFQRNHGISFYIEPPFRKALNYSDKDTFKQCGMHLLRQTPRLNHLKNKLITKSKGSLYHGIWVNSKK